MIYADDELIRALGKAGSASSLPELHPKDGQVDIIVLSDIHLGNEAGAAPPPFAEAVDGFDKLQADFTDRYAELKRELYVDGDTREIDLVVQCGDLIEGWVVGKWLKKDPTAADSVYGAVFDKLVVPSLLSTRSENTGANTSILCIPGNHDLNRMGARIERRDDDDVMTGIGPAGGTPPAKIKAFHFYQNVARRFLETDPSADWLSAESPLNPTQLPALSAAAVFTDEKLDGDRVPSSYLAVIGLDSNFAEYCNDGAENHGEISELQLERAHNLIAALAARCNDAPLHVVLAVHHHLLPVENRRLSQTRDDAYAAFGKQTSMECRDGCHSTRTSNFCVDKWLAAEASRSTMLNGSRIIQFCHEHRVSALLHGHMHQEQVLWVNRQSFDTRQFDETLAVIACPSFKRGQEPLHKRPMIEGMVRLRLRPADNAIEIAYSGNAANKDAGAVTPPRAGMQVLAPLLSASRVSDGERRLYQDVRKIIASELSSLREKGVANSEPSISALSDFDKSVVAFYREHGYARVTPGPELRGELGSSNAASIFERPRKLKRYNFLLLLRERGDCVEILLNNHRPLRHPRIANWDTLLMPAFRSVDDLLDHLGNDVARLHEGAISVRAAQNVQNITSKIRQLVDKADKQLAAVWENEIDQLESRPLTKVSPTDGTITQYQYTLVSLRPFTTGLSELEFEASLPPDKDGADDNLDDPAPITGEDVSDITQALNELPRVVLGAPDADAPEISIKALEEGGSGLRWDGRPHWTLQGKEPTDPGAEVVKVPKGLVWFPLVSKSGEALTTSGWRTCPSIVARNADVMDWVESYVGGYVRNKRAGAAPRLKLELETDPVDAAKAARSVVECVQQFPFSGSMDNLPTEPPESARDIIATPPSSLSRAMAMVPFNPELDLNFKQSKQWAYRDLPLKRVFLVRSEALGRPVIKVYSAESVTFHIGKRRNPDFWPDLLAKAGELECLGVLRPVQRYVTRGGLLRAREVNRHVLNQLSDPWGYAHALPRTGDARLAVTPPIVELLAATEHEGEGGVGNQEFVLCDGNHRVLEHVWGLPRHDGESEKEYYERKDAWRAMGLRPHAGFAMCAVAVVKAPAEPYYARPFSRYEWDVTADNVLDAAPEQHGKYAARRVLDAQLRPDLLPLLRGRKDLFRRYYRQLELGFGYLGGQAGKAG